MAVRVSLGATRSRIVRQLLGESLVLAIVGGATGLALAFAWTRALTTLMPRDTLPYWMLPTIDGRVLVTVAAVCVSTTIVFGLVPALHASNTRPSGVLKEGGRSTGQGVRTGRLTTSFLLVQFALSMIFLAHIALNIRGARSNERRDPPMEMTRLLTASISLPDRPYETAEDRLRFYRAFESRLREIGDVSSASVTTSLPLGGAPARSFDIEGRPTPSKESEQSAQMVSIGTQYFSTLQVPLVPRPRLQNA